MSTGILSVPSVDFTPVGQPQVKDYMQKIVAIEVASLQSQWRTMFEACVEKMESQYMDSFQAAIHQVTNLGHSGQDDQNASLSTSLRIHPVDEPIVLSSEATPPPKQQSANDDEESDDCRPVEISDLDGQQPDIPNQITHADPDKSNSKSKLGAGSSCKIAPSTESTDHHGKNDVGRLVATPQLDEVPIDDDTSPAKGIIKAGTLKTNAVPLNKSDDSKGGDEKAKLLGSFPNSFSKLSSKVGSSEGPIRKISVFRRAGRAMMTAQHLKDRLNFPKMVQELTGEDDRGPKATKKWREKVQTRRAALLLSKSRAPSHSTSVYEKLAKAMTPKKDDDRVSVFETPEKFAAADIPESSLWIFPWEKVDIWLHGLVIDQHSIHRRSWDGIVFVFLIVCAFRIPFVLTFLWNQNEQPFWIFANALIDLVFLFDIVLNFFTNYRSGDGLIQWGLTSIARNYAKSWMSIDLVCSIPFYRIIYAFSDEDTNWPMLLRLLRLLTLVKFPNRFKTIERYLIDPSYMRLFTAGVCLAVVVHWFACITYIGTLHTDNPDLWIGLNQFDTSSTNDKYLSLVYWVSTAMIGNRSTPQDWVSLMVSLMLFWGGLLTYFILVNNLVGILINMNLSNIEFKQEKDRRIVYMKSLKMPFELRMRILDYFDNKKAVTLGVDQQAFMEDLPYHLRQEVAFFLNQNSLDSLKVFNDCELSFLSAVMIRLRVTVCMEGDMLCVEGDIADEMYFVVSGELGVFKKNVGKIGNLLAGSIFGEGLMEDDTGNAHRKASVKASKGCVLYALARKEFAEVKAAYPEACSAFFQKITQSRRGSDSASSALK